MISNLDRETIFSHVTGILRQQVGDEPLSETTDLLNDLGIESLELVELGVKMEKAFSLTIPIGELRGCVTIEDIVQLINQLKEA
ncbi:MAG TPA: phosphopantetheine-binding protein [Ktedonobacteraceae bacterium]